MPPPWKPALASYTHLLLFIKESLLLSEVCVCMPISVCVLSPSLAPSIPATREKEGGREHLLLTGSCWVGAGIHPGTGM